MKYFYLPILMSVITTAQPGTPYTIYLYGDSISRGYGLSQFEHPNPINSVWGIANLLLSENGHPEIKVKWIGHQDSQRFWLDRHENVVNGYDVFVFENAGPHFDPDSYRLWLKVWKCAAGDSKLYLATTPDNKPAGDVSDYSVINPVVREEAVHLLDWEAAFAARAHIVDLIQPDGIHPNAFGNFVMAVSILRAQGVEVRSYASVLAAFNGYYPSINVPAALAGLLDYDKN